MTRYLRHGMALLCASALFACDAPAADETTASAQQALADDMSQQLGWGESNGTLKLQPQGVERPANGPTAVAVASDGALLVLDQLAGRVVRVAPDGSLRTLAEVPADAEDLAVGPEGAFAVWSPLRATAWVHRPSGAPAGEVKLPRVLRDVVGIELGRSLVVEARTGYQERLSIGGPAAPRSLVETLHSKREGAAMLPDGSGLLVKVSEDTAELLVMGQAVARQRAEVIARHQLPGSVSAARVVGSHGATACLRLEEVTSSPQIAVQRRALCVDARSGEVLLDEALPDVGVYLPKRELAVGAGYLAFIHPSADGLQLTRWRLPHTASAAKEVTP